jgi:hypothetical protein
LLLFAGLFSAALFQCRPSHLAHIIGPIFGRLDRHRLSSLRWSGLQ